MVGSIQATSIQPPSMARRDRPRHSPTLGTRDVTPNQPPPAAQFSASDPHSHGNPQLASSPRAWVEDSTTPTGRYYALDAIHFTYAPNARSLSTAQEIAQRTFADSILAIDEPKHDGAKPLPNSTREVKVAVTTFQNPNILRQEQATREPFSLHYPITKFCTVPATATLNWKNPSKVVLQ